MPRPPKPPKRGRPPKPVEHRGGAREGAGRKPSGHALVRQVLYVTPETKARCEALKEKGFDCRDSFEQMIEKMCKALGME